MNPPAWHLGIDGGATQAKWSALGPGGALHEAQTPGVNPSEGGEAGLHAAIQAAVAAAGRAHGNSEDTMASIGVGWAGVDRPEEVERLAAWVRGRWPACRAVWVGNDALPALVAATGEAARPAGIVCLAGTGAMAWGRTAAGRVARCGGWGAVWGDDGSAFWIGHQALRISARMADGRRPRTPLVDKMLEILDLREAGELVGWARRRDAAQFKRDVAAVAPAVLALADAGDPAARAIRAQALAQLALMTRSVARQLDPWDETAAAADPSATRAIVCAGGLWRHPRLLEAFQRLLERWDLTPCAPRRLEVPASRGALSLGRAAR